MKKVLALLALLALSDAVYAQTIGPPASSGGSGTPGGSNTQVQYNNSSAFGGISGATTNGTALTLVAPVLGTPASGTLTNTTGLPAAGVVGTAAVLGANTFTALQTITQASANSGVLASTGYSLTGSDATAMVNITGTLNTTGVPTVIKHNITNTAAGAGSFYFDYQTSSVSVFQLDAKISGSNPLLHVPNLVVGASIYVMNAISAAMGTPNFNNAKIGIDGGVGVWQSSALPFGWSATTDLHTFALDTIFTRGGVATFQHGAANTTAATTPVAQTTQVQSWASSTSADQNGATWTQIGSLGTGAGTAGKIIWEIGKTGTTATTQQIPYPMLSLNPGNATTSTVQFGDGTNFTTYDSCTALTTGATGVVACTGSAIRFKIPESQLAFAKAEEGVDKLHPAVWVYKPEFQKEFGSKGEQRVSLYADDVEKMDKRCVTYDHGKLRDYSDRCVVAYLVATVQKQQAEIAKLKIRVSK